MRFLAIIGLLSMLASAPQANESLENMKPQHNTLFDFAKPADIQAWQIVNDGVMGGLSQSTITHQESGTALFNGAISLENNGGFASTRSVPRIYDLEGYTGLLFRVKGDGKRYQFRLRTNNNFDGIAYSYPFDTKAGEWVDITIPFAEFIPVFRGRVLNDIGAVAPSEIQQLGFLITTKKAEAFSLEVDWIKAY